MAVALAEKSPARRAAGGSERNCVAEPDACADPPEKGQREHSPGLVRDPDFTGPGIDVEVWAVPEDQFGGFVAAVPPPLAIGNVQLDNDEWVKGFVCEPVAIHGAIDWIWLFTSVMPGWKT